MISDDWRAQDTGSVAQTVVSIGTTDTAFVAQNLNRVTLVIQAPSTNRVTLSWSGAAVLDQGVTLYPGGPPLVLNLKDHGFMIKAAIRAITVTAAQSLAYVENVNTNR